MPRSLQRMSSSEVLLPHDPFSMPAICNPGRPEAIGKAGLKVAVDPMFGAGSGYLRIC